MPVLRILIRVRERHRFPEKHEGSIWIVEQLVSQIPVVVVFLVRSVQLRILCPQISEIVAQVGVFNSKGRHVFFQCFHTIRIRGIGESGRLLQVLNF